VPADGTRAAPSLLRGLRLSRIGSSAIYYKNSVTIKSRVGNARMSATVFTQACFFQFGFDHPWPIALPVALNNETYTLAR
jgi:hypothetical protein